ncbi:MAG: DUF2752 domain-containing protein [Verrucomicrobia bacterium]|nr:DUF2752 domain-containing protein [Cytophagales bacterium]
MKFARKIIKDHLELIIWVFAMIFLALTNQHWHFSICPIKNIFGFSCPGCGLGHAVAAALRLDLKASFDFHPFGIPAVLIIFHRIFQLSKKVPFKLNS